MRKRLSRRDLLRTAAAAGAGYLAPGGASRLSQGAGVIPGAPPGSAERILPLTSTSEVFVPPRGEGFMKFSFDFPEPSVRFEDLQLSFRLYTYENTYALDQTRMTVEDQSVAS